MVKDLVGDGKSLGSGNGWLEFKLKDHIFFCHEEFAIQEFRCEFLLFSDDHSEFFVVSA